MAAGTEKMPDWVIDDIQNAQFKESTSLKRMGYILELYDSEGKADMQLYEPVEDGRHIVTMDLPEGINADGLERGVVYLFTFEQYKAPLSEKTCDYLRNEKGLDMGAIYRFGLNSLEILDSDN